MEEAQTIEQRNKHDVREESLPIYALPLAIDDAWSRTCHGWSSGALSDGFD